MRISDWSSDVCSSDLPVDRPCPRAERLRAALGAVVAAGGDPEDLLDTLTATSDPALFLRGDVYGTRASTLIAINGGGAVPMAGPRHGNGGRSAGTTGQDFRIELDRPGSGQRRAGRACESQGRRRRSPFN